MIGIDEQQRELFTTVACNHVVYPTVFRNQASHAPQHLIARLMTKAIVVLTEVIDIDHQHAERNPGAQRSLHFQHQVFLQIAMVVKSRQSVGRRQLRQPPIRLFQRARSFFHPRIEILLHRFELLLLLAQRRQQCLCRSYKALLSQDRLDAQRKLKLFDRTTQEVTDARVTHRQRQQLIVWRRQKQQLARGRRLLMHFDQRFQAAFPEDRTAQDQQRNVLVFRIQLVEPRTQPSRTLQTFYDAALTKAREKLLPESQ